MSAFDRMKALERYLDECRELSNFQDILQQQCKQVVKEIADMASLELVAAAPLLAMVRQNRLWTNDMKETISQALHHKVTQTLGAGKMISNRMPLQDYSWFPVYLMQKDWDTILQADTIANVGMKCNVVCERLWKLGLRAPSEPTYSMITAVLLLREANRFSDGIQLRSSYLTVKQLVKNALKGRTDDNSGDEFYKVLPPMPMSLPDERYKKVFPEGDVPVPLPKGLTIEYLQQLQALVPERSNNKKLQMDVQFPKSMAWGCSAPAQFVHGGPQPLMLTYAHPHGHMGHMATPAQLALPASSFAPPALSPPALSPPAPAPPGIPVSAAASSVTGVPQEAKADTKAICDVEIEVVPKPKEPSPKKTLALTDGQPDAQPTQEPKPAVEVAQRLEDALCARDQEKKEKNIEAKEEKTKPEDQKQAQQQTAKNKGMKRPASARVEKTKQEPTKKPAQKTKEPSKKSAKNSFKLAVEKSGAAPKTDAKKAGAKSKASSKKAVKKNCKGVINQKTRLKLSPKGCSRCRFVKGCCDSCWVDKGYRVI